MESEQRELALRAHIRHLLLDYSLTHLSTNYVTWTQETATELLSEGLAYVSTTDPTDPLLPTDPYENLLRAWGPKKLEPYNETWKAEAQVVQLIKTHMPSKNERPTNACWDTDADADHETWVMLRLMSPMLSASSMRQTPRPGLLIGALAVPCSWQEVVRSHRLNPVPSEDLPEEPPPKLHDILDLKIALDAQTHKEVTALYRAVQASSRNSVRQEVNKETQEFLRADSPPFEVPQLASPPIFPRDRRPGYQVASPGHSIAKIGPASLRDLPSIVPTATLKKDEEEAELYTQHMVVVDGWQAYAAPSSPLTPGTPSLGDSSSEVEELFLPSPSNHGRPLIEELMDARLDEVEMPRSQKIGGTQEKPKVLGHGQSLSAFLHPIRRRHESLDQAKIVSTPKSQPSSPHTTITASMLGQPPTALAGFGADDDHSMHPTQGDWPSEGSDPDTDVILKRIYGDELVTEDISQLIVNEKLDGRDTLLMDVPIMPPPNEHAPSNMFLPRQTFELLAPAKTKPDQPGDQAVSSPSRLGQLKKVKGMQALTIELSWIPFKFGSSIPTDDEVSGVADSVQDALTAELRRDDPTLVIQLSELFNKAMHLDDGLDDERNVPSTRNCLNDSWDPLELVSREGEPVDMDFVLTRDERRTLRGHHEDEDLGSSDKENEDLTDSLQYEEDGPPPKRLRTTQEQDDSYLDDDLERAAPTDDSGVFLSPLEAMSKRRTAGFAEMAYAAEGFEGPYTDGNLFDDIDPVHELEFASDAPDVYMHHPSAKASEPRPSHTSALRRPFSWEHDEAEADARLAAPVRGASGLNHEANLVPAEHNISRGLPSAISRIPRTTAASAHCAEDRDDLGFPGSTSAENTAPVMAAHTQSVNVSSARRSLAEFLALMGKKGMTIAPSSSPPVPGPSNIELRMQSGGETIESLDSSIVVIPAEVLGPDTLCLPESGLRPAAMHRYLASVALLQKRVLVRDLSSRGCCIDLVEREDLGDADLILDSDTAVAFASLAALPSQVDSVLARLTRLSWRYSHILMVFEAYPNSLSFKSDLGSPRPVPNPFFAAVIKAVKKLRRDLSIAEACQTKKAGSAIRFAFATSVEEAALYVRYSGDDAEARDTAQGALWGAREWLDFDEQEGECDLAGVDGMNAFAASIILSQMSLDDFLDTSPEDRVQYFGPYVGHDRLVRFNEELQRRAQAVMSSSPSSHGATVPA